jgi:small subunit ribosomal protein S9
MRNSSSLLIRTVRNAGRSVQHHCSPFAVNIPTLVQLRSLSSSPPPPPQGRGGGAFRLRRPDMNRPPPIRGQQQQQQRNARPPPTLNKRNAYANPSPFQTASPGTRTGTMSIVPAGDYDDSVRDMDDDDGDDNKIDEPIEEMTPLEVKRRDYLLREEEKKIAQRKRWIENARPPERVSVIDDRGRSYGRGGRKRAQARVWIQPGLGEVMVNRKRMTEYFWRLYDREQVLAPFVATETCGMFDVQAMVKGGGLTGQAGAIRLGVARALNHYNPDQYRAPLKFLGYLTRDPRKVERKKIGHVKARKSPQWVRR